MHLSLAFWSCTLSARLDRQIFRCCLFRRLLRRLGGFRIPGGSPGNRYIIFIIRVRFRGVELMVIIARDHIFGIDRTVAKSTAISWAIWVWKITVIFWGIWVWVDIQYAILTNFSSYRHLKDRTVDAIFTTCVGHRGTDATQCYVTLHFSVKHTSQPLCKQLCQ